jgi:Na+-transporting NADH:ubiquinone oxidoreductase subunit NqrB
MSKPLSPDLVARPRAHHWLSRIETLGTTLIVVMIGGLMLWFEGIERDRRLAVVIGSAAILYVFSVVVFGRRSNPSGIAWWPFALAGVAAGSVAEFINAQFLVTWELLVAGLTGVVIGTAHWTALRVWLHLTESRAG